MPVVLTSHPDESDLQRARRPWRCALAVAAFLLVATRALAAGTPTPPAVGAGATVDDPMLAPVPAPSRLLESWQDAVTAINARTVDVRVAAQEVIRARALRRQAIAGLLPTLNATGSTSYQMTGVDAETLTTPTGVQIQGPNPESTGQITATLPIIAPLAWYGVGTAERNVFAAQLGLDDKRRTALLAATNAIVQSVAAERAAEINRVALRGALARLQLTQRKLSLQDATRLDVVRAEQDAAAERATLVRGDEALREAREALGLALGFGEPFGVAPSLSLKDIERTITKVCTPTVQSERSDIRGAATLIEVANRGITAAWLEFAPTVSVSSTATLTDYAASQPDGLPGAWGVSARITIPLWDGGIRYGNLRIAEVNREEAKISFDAVVRSATVEMAQALRSVGVAEQARAVALSARDSSVEAAGLAEYAYKVGTGTSFDLINTAQQAHAAELDLALKDLQVMSARVRAILSTSNCTSH